MNLSDNNVFSNYDYDIYLLVYANYCLLEAVRWIFTYKCQEQGSYLHIDNCKFDIINSSDYNISMSANTFISIISIIVLFHIILLL